MIQNLVTMETFAIRDGLIHHVEVFPFFTLPYGMGNGWTPGSGKYRPFQVPGSTFQRF